MTTEEQTMKLLRSMAVVWNAQGCSGFAETMAQAAEFISFRIPKKPTVGGFAGMYCPNCESVQRRGSRPVKYCTWCGQAIDFSEIISPQKGQI